MSSTKKPAILCDPVLMAERQRSLIHRHRKDNVFQWVCLLVANISVLVLGILLATILATGIGSLTTQFIAASPNPDPTLAGLFPAIMGSIWLLVLTMFIAIPLGVATAVVLEEFPPRHRKFAKIHSLLKLNITNLAGVPSVVFGIIGLTLFASMFGLFGNERLPAFEVGAKYVDQFFNEGDFVLEVPVNGPDAAETKPTADMVVLSSDGQVMNLNLLGDDADWPTDPELARRSLRSWDLPGRNKERSWWYFRLPFGRGILAGALTLMLVILPIIIISTQEALRAVPPTLRHASLALGATPWQTVRHVTLPAALPGILTGSIIAMSRAIGEAAPILMIAGIVFITKAPSNLMDDFTAMPLQIYNWAGRPQSEFHDLAASGIIVLLTVLLLFNAIAVILRHKHQKPLS